MSRRPVIGVTAPAHGGRLVGRALELAVRMAGGRARRLAPGERTRVADLDGLLLSGGGDIDPETYGAPARFKPRGSGVWQRVRRVLVPELEIDPNRDAFELDLLGQAIDRGRPVLGICRGSQLMNVFLGGTLHQDLGDFYEEARPGRSLLPRKQVAIDPDSQLATVLGTCSLRVNSLHDQAVAELGQRLRAVARELSEVVQAVEHQDAAFVLGVQWHPELLLQDARQRRLFEGLITATRS